MKTLFPLDVVDFGEPAFQRAAFLIVIAPVFWNCLARLEYRTHLLTKLAGGNRYYGCYALAVWIFFFSLYRDFRFDEALAAQPQAAWIAQSIFLSRVLAGALFAAGSVLVLSSMYQLGVTGTYLGDYFGILMSHRVRSFPFNIMEDPMYNGSTMCFVARSLYAASPAGLLMSVLVFLVYQIALRFEGPFTGKIYAKAAQAAAASASGRVPSAAKARSKSPLRKEA